MHKNCTNLIEDKEFFLSSPNHLTSDIQKPLREFQLPNPTLYLEKTKDHQSK